jgi:glycosyltransferase involved in cell wall biosynthesis
MGWVTKRQKTAPPLTHAQGLRVLHVTGVYAPAWGFGGPIESLDQLCRHLARTGCAVRVLTTDSAGRGRNLKNILLERETELEPGLSVHYCHRRAGVQIAPAMPRQLPTYIRWADIVHVTGVYGFPTPLALLGCKLARKPVVISPRGALQRWPGRRRAAIKSAWERMCRWLAPQTLSLHVTSEEEARESVGRLGERLTFLIENGVTVPRLMPEPLPRQGEELRLLYLGRLDRKKGIENLLAACKLLFDSGMRLKLAVAGTGDRRYEQSLWRRIDEFKLGQAVSLLGEVRDGAKEEVFRAADVLVMPSFTENFGVVVAEALARCVPVIASKGTPWRAVEQHGCGLYVDNSPESLARSIQRISTMPLHQMGEKGRRWMITNFSWPEIALRMFRAYRSLLKTNGSDTGGPALESHSC